MNKKKKGLKIIVLIAFFVALAFFARYNSGKSVEKLSNDHVFTKVVINEHKVIYKGASGIIINFQLMVSGIKAITRG